MLRKVVVVLAAIAVLAVVNVTVAKRERLLADGRVVRLELAPVDPRSLMQGDYMALQFRVAIDAQPSLATAAARDGALVLALDGNDVGRFVRRDDGSPLRERDVRLRYRLRDDRVRLATNAWFFEEGQGERFAKARYGEFRVSPAGEALLTRLLDEGLQPIAAQ
jgi:uncharacterized membrane-anchored protein